MTENIYDLVIVGGGVSGLTAAIYSARYKLKTIVFTDSFGGTTGSAHKICNYPGFKEISGMDLMLNLTNQVKSLDVDINFEKIIDIFKKDDFFIINTDVKTVKSKKVLLAIGKKKRHLGIENEDK
ncbi:MAG: NAD(P)/FAD-dependent oxidoreductase, partial [Candidatus ainarchaeum sp.]|nr:NAD(P)/FAD-dependent oxidoreductase [Candidatus ainarchaeum sp.]